VQQNTLIRLAQLERCAHFMGWPPFYISKHHDGALRAWKVLKTLPQNLYGFATKHSLFSGH
jgi:hypothetical protein